MLGFMDAPAFFKDKEKAPKSKEGGASAAETKIMREEKEFKKQKKAFARKEKPYQYQRAVMTKHVFLQLRLWNLSRRLTSFSTRTCPHSLLARVWQHGYTTSEANSAHSSVQKRMY